MGTLTFDIWSVLILLGVAIGAGAAMWALIPRWHGIPPTSSRPKWVRKALEAVDLRSGQVVYDLGSGDGTVLVIAAREYGAHAVGYEIEPLHCVVAWFRALFGGVLGRVSVRRKDLYAADVERADVVFVHLNPTIVENLRSSLPHTLRPGTRIVSLDFPFEGWEPTHMDIGYLIFAYEMPPQPGSLETYLRKEFDLVQPS
jgi:SAM-dependent methyltransferase